METIEETKLLGTIVTNDLRWDKNTNHLVKKGYTRMDLLRKLSSFNAPQRDLLLVYKVFIRSILEHSSNVWHSGLTLENETDLERVQKIAMKIILKDKYISHENALITLELETLKERREYLCLNFARKCLKNKKMKHLFPPNDSKHIMKPRNYEHFKVLFARTNRFKESPIIYMQNILNREIKRKKDQDKIWNI